MAMVGIDLGTTNSVIAYFDGEAKLIKNAADQIMTPSVISLDPKLGLLVGEAAKRRQIIHSDKSVARFKRFMGSDKIVRLGKKEFSAVDLSAIVLRRLKQDAEAALDTTVDAAVISVPAYFNAVQRQATKDAARLAGLRVERLINEPTAAALAYGLNNSDDVSKVIVLDLGGGTFDVSLIEIFDGVIEVHASAGDALLGGEDFTDLIARHLAKEAGGEWAELDAEKRQYFLGLAELFKIRLSDQHSVSLGVSMKDQEKNLTITQQDFEQLAGQLLLRMRRPIDKCLYDSKTAVADIDRVVLVGGATRMPMIRSMVSRIFRQLPVRSIDPDHVVALGAAVQAGLAEKDQALDDIVMTDVTPFSMGIATHNHQAPDDPHRLLFEPLISRNTTLPCSREGYFSTVRNNQTQILLQIYQGEAAYARDNIKLGEISVAVPPGQEGHEGVNVRFTYDTSGLLDVDARVVSTGKTYNLLIKGDAAALSQEQVDERLRELAALKSHPRENEKNQILLETLKQLCELLLGDDRHYAMTLLMQFENALDSQDQEVISKAQGDITPQIRDLEARYGRF